MPGSHVCGVAEILTTIVYSKYKTFGLHKTVCRARNPAFWVGAVTCRAFCLFGTIKLVVCSNFVY